MSDEKLESCPCPFCGEGKDIIPPDAEGAVDSFQIFCPNCGIMSPEFATMKEAIQWWNRRAKPAPKVTALSTWREEFRKNVAERMSFINSHQEELLEAFVAKTGLQPDECQIMIQRSGPEFGSGQLLEAVWVERKKPAPAEVPEMPHVEGRFLKCLRSNYKEQVAVCGEATPLQMVATFGIASAVSRDKDCDDIFAWLAACDRAGCTVQQVVDAILGEKD